MSNKRREEKWRKKGQANSRQNGGQANLKTNVANIFSFFYKRIMNVKRITLRYNKNL